MSRRPIHGLIILAIALAVAGAMTTSKDWEVAGASALVAEEPDPVVDGGSEVEEPVGPTFQVPIRSARLSDNVPTDDGDRPVLVRVAGIGLEAPIISVGVDDNNQFAVPAADTVGWYQHSSSPGTPGAAVLAAHVDYGGRPGAFFNLSEVLPGDTLELEMEDGTVIAYKVTGNTIYDKTELPANELFRKDGDSVLQLITCGGTFNPDKRSYAANVVVTAEPLTS
ncbi:MAG: class F sortase [Actinomycetia bacterium]|nr:class F sortase [Actinomycetes bacterium]